MGHRDFIKVACILLVLTITMSVFIRVEAITWSVNVKQLTTYTYYDGYPAFIQISDGSVWLVWAKETQGNLTLYYKTTSDLGKTWSNEMNLTNLLAPGQNQNPSIIQAQNGTIWVAWTSDRPPPPPPPTPNFYMDASPQNLTIPQGQSKNSTILVTSINNFSETVDLTVFSEPTGVTTAFDPAQVVPPPNGTANSTLTISASPTATPGNYTLTVMGRGDHLMHSADIYLEITVAGETSQTSTQTHIFSPSSTLTSSSTGDYEIYYKASHDNGVTWSRDLQLTDNDVDDLRPAIIQLSNGTLMIFWQTYISGSFEIVYKTTTDGTSWSDIKQLTTDSAHDKAPAATQTMDGRIWVAWASRRTGDYEIFYKIYDGDSWLNDMKLTNSTNSDVGPAILQAVNEEIFVFWGSIPANGSSNIYYMKSSNNGGSWSESAEFTASEYEDLWPATIQTHDTKIWVAWVSNRGDQPDGNWDIYLQTSLAGDVNEDNVVDVVDLSIVSLSYGAFEGAPEYNSDADINNDGIVDLQDLAIVAHYLGET